MKGSLFMISLTVEHPVEKQTAGGKGTDGNDDDNDDEQDDLDYDGDDNMGLDNDKGGAGPESKEDKSQTRLSSDGGPTSHQKQKAVTDSAQEDGGNEAINNDISEAQVYQLLRDMELVDHEGDFIWEDSNEIEEDYTEANTDKMESEGAGGMVEMQLPNDIIPSLQDYQSQHQIFQCDEEQKDGARTEAVDSGEGITQVQVQEAENPKKRQGRPKAIKKWGPVVAERKSLRIMADNRTAAEKATSIKKTRNLEDNYPAKGKKTKSVSKVKVPISVAKIAKLVDVVVDSVDSSVFGDEGRAQAGDSVELAISSTDPNFNQKREKDCDIGSISKNRQGKHPEKTVSK
ncbi:unnamed protein product [Urochloa humidicola]